MKKHLLFLCARLNSFLTQRFFNKEVCIVENKTKKGLPIQLSFVAEIDHGDLHKENVAFKAIGLYYIKENTTYLLFDEKQDGGIIKTIVKITNSDVSIARSGFVTMRQLFRAGEVTTGTYKNQYGIVEMVTQTEKINYEWDAESRQGTLAVSYVLHLHEEQVGRYFITITFKEE